MSFSAQGCLQISCGTKNHQAAPMLTCLTSRCGHWRKEGRLGGVCASPLFLYLKKINELQWCTRLQITDLRRAAIIHHVQQLLHKEWSYPSNGTGRWHLGLATTGSLLGLSNRPFHCPGLWLASEIVSEIWISEQLSGFSLESFWVWDHCSQSVCALRTTPHPAAKSQGRAEASQHSGSVLPEGM